MSRSPGNPSPISPPVEAVVESDSERSPSSLPSYGQSQIQTLFETLCDKKSTEDSDEFLVKLLLLAEDKLGREVTLDELKQNFGGIVSKTTDSSDSKVAKNREEFQSLGTTIDSGMPEVPRFLRARPEDETGGGDQTGEDSDPDVETARQAFLKAKKKKKEKPKETRTNTVDVLDSSHTAPDELPMAVNWFSTKLQSLNRSQLEMLFERTRDNDSAEADGTLVEELKQTWDQDPTTMLKTDPKTLNPTPMSMTFPVVQCTDNHGTIDTRIVNSFNKEL